MQTIALYATDTMADWEYAYVTPEVTRAEQERPGRFRLVVVGDGPAPVTTLGGLPVTPGADLDDLDPDTVAVLVVPGFDSVASGHE